MKYKTIEPLVLFTTKFLNTNLQLGTFIYGKCSNCLYCITSYNKSVLEGYESTNMNFKFASVL